MAIGLKRSPASERFRREHRALAQLAARIRADFRVGHHLEPGEHVPPRLIDELIELRDHLGMLFALEESDKTAPDMHVLAPQLTPGFEALRDEHLALFGELCAMIDYSENAFCRHKLDDLLERIERRFNEFSAHWQAHERHENNLLLRAYQDDLGVGD